MERARTMAMTPQVQAALRPAICLSSWSPSRVREEVNSEESYNQAVESSPDYIYGLFADHADPLAGVWRRNPSSGAWNMMMEEFMQRALDPPAAVTLYFPSRANRVSDELSRLPVQGAGWEFDRSRERTERMRDQARVWSRPQCTLLVC